jgi:hypothetical protein
VALAVMGYVTARFASEERTLAEPGKSAGVADRAVGHNQRHKLVKWAPRAHALRSSPQFQIGFRDP